MAKANDIFSFSFSFTNGMFQSVDDSYIKYEGLKFRANKRIPFGFPDFKFIFELNAGRPSASVIVLYNGVERHATSHGERHLVALGHFCTNIP